MVSGKVFELTELCPRFHLLSDLYDLSALYTIWFLVYDFVFFFKSLSHVQLFATPWTI